MEPTYQGNKDLLTKSLTGFLASRTIQTEHVLACYDWATSLDPKTDCVVGGFQSSMERDVLHFLVKCKIPVIIVLARRFYKDLTEELLPAYNDGRLLFISLNNNYKTTRANACIRNRYVAQISSKLVFGMYSEQSSLAKIYHAIKNEKDIKIIDKADSL